MGAAQFSNGIHARLLTLRCIQNGESSKGCGIVEFEQPEEALRAISLLSNSVRCHATMLLDAAAVPRAEQAVSAAVS